MTRLILSCNNYTVLKLMLSKVCVVYLLQMPSRIHYNKWPIDRTAIAHLSPRKRGRSNMFSAIKDRLFIVKLQCGPLSNLSKILCQLWLSVSFGLNIFIFSYKQTDTYIYL